MEGFFELVYDTVKKIPRGKVATYGQIAALAGSPRGARTVGWALHILKSEQLKYIPWHRVINREGRVSTTCPDHTSDEQAFLLQKEGVHVEKKHDVYRIDLHQYQWLPGADRGR